MCSGEATPPGLTVGVASSPLLSHRRASSMEATSLCDPCSGAGSLQ
ncbi:rCG31104 [Rattus norvegicus]|uniref:RCG31104 n=1 Tax=Rattus norvegicus TaxID=10116 RepID=A6ISK6_RAT|nr:rCG31104 [Rattus norvegicus]